MKLKDIGIAVFETTSAGSIAGVASSLFTPTSSGRPAVIRRTRKKKDKNPSVYEGSARPEYHNTQVKGSDATPTAKPGRTKHPFKGKLVGEGDMEADREAGIKWVDNPDWERLHNMDLDMVKDFLGHKEDITEGLTRQHFQLFANVLRDIENRDKREDHAEFLIRVFKQDNEKFDVQKFLKAADLVTYAEGDVTEKAPPGREKQVKALKGKVDNPYAVAWASYNKGKK